MNFITAAVSVLALREKCETFIPNYSHLHKYSESFTSIVEGKATPMVRKRPRKNALSLWSDINEEHSVLGETSSSADRKSSSSVQWAIETEESAEVVFSGSGYVVTICGKL